MEGVLLPRKQDEGEGLFPVQHANREFPSIERLRGRRTNDGRFEPFFCGGGSRSDAELPGENDFAVRVAARVGKGDG